MRHYAPYLRKLRRKEKRCKEYWPPEEWFDGEEGKWKVVVRDPGKGFFHPVPAVVINSFLSQLPKEWTSRLGVVCLAQMTRKKWSRACYGLQWGSTVYLYPAEEDLCETYNRPPGPKLRIEVQKAGGRFVTEGKLWVLQWDLESLRRFYLYNVLLHELAHTLDDRNRNWRDRERFAEAFVERYGSWVERRIPLDQLVWPAAQENRPHGWSGRGGNVGVGALH